ncbi:uncharacterized protein LOC115765752 isoform X1 [Drosophila novamexicana]|uniref:uncharacterized protein LOC115765752 isoform X1 n=1 Tax=Drosophila novamexicana TaxID=47314 RepID=UPI0011E5BAB0|nr:uncharacterized protein LOC115765752 isoform X1 [Drosophila novamexicana]
MSTSTLSTPVASKSVLVKYKRLDKEARSPLFGVLDKFSIAEQVEVRRNSRQLPQLLMATWRETYTCLDFEEFQKQLIGEALQQFLRKMRRHFSSVRFNSDQLQEQLNLLERCGINELPGVRECEIRWDSSKGDNCAMWPLHSLPKLLTRLHRLQLHMPVQMGFVEQFGQLKLLALHEDVSPEAFAAIWDSCERLKCLQILGSGKADITGISRCTKLQELTLPVAAIDVSTATEICQLPQLKFLELQQKEANAETTLVAMSLILYCRTNDIKTIQINGSHLGSAEWLLSLELQRCMRLDGLMLIDCQFGAMDVTTLCMLPMLSYAAFCHCSNLNNEQVAAFVNACPVLTQLYLIDCPQLTIQLLYSLFNMRCIEQLGTPALGLYLQEGEPLLEEFKLNQAADTGIAGDTFGGQSCAARAVHISSTRVQAAINVSSPF